MSVVSLYYYIRVVKMMVVKEPQEMSESIRNYPEISWTQIGMKPLQAALVFTLIFTAIAGIASNPLFSLSNQAVKETQFLQAKAPNAKSVAVLPPSAQ
jgi:NAD(P)H-quinone oxidoreductase subunit 2